MPEPAIPAPGSAPTAAATLVSRIKGILETIRHDVGKFGIIGLIAFIIDLGGMNLLTHTVLEGRITTAKIISGVVATIFAWAGSRWWTFAHRANRPVSHEVALFFLVNAIGLAITTLTLVISHYVLHFQSRLADNIATVFGIGLATLFRFWAYSQVVFANEPMDQDTSPLSEDEHLSHE